MEMIITILSIILNTGNMVSDIMYKSVVVVVVVLGGGFLVIHIVVLCYT